jgi:CRP-like cAMP-binding protein
VTIPGTVGRRVQLHAPLEDLAGVLGMSRVTISREIAKLLRDGVVTKDKRDIIVLDPAALQHRMPPIYRDS